MHESVDTEFKEIELPLAGQIELLQLTDCHIMADPHERLQGFDTRRSLDDVLAAVKADRTDFDLLLATGDLSQDSSCASYRYLGERLESLGMPVFWLPGNHDDVDTVIRCLSGASISAARQIKLGNWIILMLNSTVSGQVRGYVPDSELAFVDSALSANPDRHALIALHHQAIDTGSEWLDHKGLESNAELRQRLIAHENLRGVIWGHVHQAAHHQTEGIQWMSCPSTCVQFQPGSKEFATEELAPGYRRITLGADGSISSDICRCPAA